MVPIDGDEVSVPEVLEDRCNIGTALAVIEANFQYVFRIMLRDEFPHERGFGVLHIVQLTEPTGYSLNVAQCSASVATAKSILAPYYPSGPGTARIG